MLDVWVSPEQQKRRRRSREFSTEDAPAFKARLQAIAQRVAEAAKDGGFMGFGGVQVSDAEKATPGGDLRRAEAHRRRAPPNGSPAKGEP
jgi:hypothetical protein